MGFGEFGQRTVAARFKEREGDQDMSQWTEKVHWSDNGYVECFWPASTKAADEGALTLRNSIT